MGQEQGEGSIIGTDAFGLTEQNVVEAAEEAWQNLEAYRQNLSDPDKRIRKDAQQSLPLAEMKAQAFQAAPGEILAQAQTFYERAKELTASALKWQTKCWMNSPV